MKGDFFMGENKLLMSEILRILKSKGHITTETYSKVIAKLQKQKEKDEPTLHQLKK